MQDKNITFLDGGMSRELEKRGAPFRQPEWSALAIMETPHIVQDVHASYIESGARVITTNSYALVPFHIGETRFAADALTLAERCGQVAQAAVKASGTSTLVAGSLPPLFGSYRADLYQEERVSEIVTPLIKGLAPYVDIWLAETQCLIAETTAVKSVLDNLTKDNKPFWVSFTLEDSEPTPEPLLRSGESVALAVEAMSKLGVAAILFNCCQPEIIEDAINVATKTLADLNISNIQLGAYANAFAPQPKDATANDGLDEVRKDLTPPAYLIWAQKWQASGATLIGGCCGIGPEHIAHLSQQLN
jgi:S-methylmethionine-dependent homocysteine/selenocysteine methylase